VTEEQEKPLTREDVLKMIGESGGPEKLNLLGRNLEGIDLSGVNLEGSNLHGANLQGSNLVTANLEYSMLGDANIIGANLAASILRNASLNGANLENANLAGADMQNAMLRRANLKGARLLNANLQGAHLMESNLEGAMLVNVKWHPKYIIGDENLEVDDEGILEKKERVLGKRRILGYIAGVYCYLKKVHNAAGMYDAAGAFYFREMTIRRKALSWFPNPLPKAVSKIIAILCGYGEKPERVVLSAAAIVLGLGSIYIAGTQSPQLAYYFSAVSFTALGYGAWINASSVETWVKALGALEAFIGVFMMALFLVTFTRKMTR